MLSKNGTNCVLFSDLILCVFSVKFGPNSVILCHFGFFCISRSAHSGTFVFLMSATLLINHMMLTFFGYGDIMWQNPYPFWVRSDSDFI